MSCFPASTWTVDPGDPSSGALLEVSRQRPSLALPGLPGLFSFFGAAVAGEGVSTLHAGKPESSGPSFADPPARKKKARGVGTVGANPAGSPCSTASACECGGCGGPERWARRRSHKRAHVPRSGVAGRPNHRVPCRGPRVPSGALAGARPRASRGPHQQTARSLGRRGWSRWGRAGRPSARQRLREPRNRLLGALPGSRRKRTGTRAMTPEEAEPLRDCRSSRPSVVGLRRPGRRRRERRARRGRGGRRQSQGWHAEEAQLRPGVVAGGRHRNVVVRRCGPCREGEIAERTAARACPRGLPRGRSGGHLRPPGDGGLRLPEPQVASVGAQPGAAVISGLLDSSICA